MIRLAVRAVILLAVAVTCFWTIPECLADQKGAAEAAPLDDLELSLERKSFLELSHVREWRITGHWVLQVADTPRAIPFGAQRLNCVVIRCSRSAGTCEEYRAQVFRRSLFQLDPMVYRIVSWDANKVVARLEVGTDAEMLLHIDLRRETADLEFRREPSSGKSRVFERFTLE